MRNGGRSAYAVALTLLGCAGTVSEDAPPGGGAGGTATDGTVGGAASGGEGSGSLGHGGLADADVGIASGGAPDGSGGAGGAPVIDPPSCFADGPRRSTDPHFLTCESDADCTERLSPTCCPFDTAIGLTRTAACSIPATSCGTIACGHSDLLFTENGSFVHEGEKAMATCDTVDGGARRCRTHPVPDTGPLPCGTAYCSESQLCVHALPIVVGGRAPPFCADIPASCIDTPPVSCSCVRGPLCSSRGTQQCIWVNGRNVFCTAAPPEPH